MKTEELLKVLPTNCGVIGIDQHGHIYGGYDVAIDIANNACNEWRIGDNDLEDEFVENQLSREYRNVLADEMIRRWIRYKCNIK